MGFIYKLCYTFILNLHLSCFSIKDECVCIKIGTTKNTIKLWL